MISRFHSSLTVCMVGMAVTTAGQADNLAGERIVFVCEHGAAKSVTANV